MSSMHHLKKPAKPPVPTVERAVRSIYDYLQKVVVAMPPPTPPVRGAR